MSADESMERVSYNDRGRTAPRIRLASLLLVPLLVSPLFFGLLLASDDLARHGPRGVGWRGLWIFVYAALFTCVFVLVSRRNRDHVGPRTLASELFASIKRGGFYGLTFGLQFVVGWAGGLRIMSPEVRWLGSAQYWASFLPSLGYAGAILYFVATFAFIGMTVGAILGIGATVLSSSNDPRPARNENCGDRAAI